MIHDGGILYCVKYVVLEAHTAPPLLSSISQGGFTGEKNIPLISSLRPLATRIPSLGRVGQCAWELGLPKIRKCHFLRDP